MPHRKKAWPHHHEGEIPGHIRGLIFDCDGTLIDTMPVHYRAWVQALEGSGIVFTEDKFYSLAGMATRKIGEVLGAEQGKPIDAEAVALRKEKLYLGMMATAPVIEHVVAIARREKPRRKLAVASGGFRRVVQQALTTTGIGDLFDIIVGSDEVAHGKPAPDTFLEAAKRMGLGPRECLVYEDGDLGFKAAKAAGMQVIDVRPWYLPRNK